LGRENNIVGKFGERAASAFLKKKGYRVLEKNLRTPFGELDIVARKGPFLVFVEVKTRAGYSLGPPYLSMTWKKQRSIVKNAFSYLKRRGLVYSNWRIDVVSVNLDSDGRVEKIELIENAVTEDCY